MWLALFHRLLKMVQSQPSNLIRLKNTTPQSGPYRDVRDLSKGDCETLI